MKILSKNELINIFLRITPVGAKFGIIVFLAEVLSTNNYAKFNLIITTITLGIYFFGLDFYHFSNREIILSKDDTLEKIASAVLLYFIIYVCFSIVGYFSLPNLNFIESDYLRILLLLMITEHLNHECYRLYICFKKIKTANIIFFFKGVTWTTAIFILFLSGNQHKITIDLILKLWLVANICSLVAVFFNVKVYKHIKDIEFNLKFIKKGFKICLWIFLSTISLKIIEYSGRYISDFFLEDDETAVFLFYSSIAISLSLYIDTVVTSFEYPKLVESYKTNHFEIQKVKFKKKLIKHIIICVMLIFLIGLIVVNLISNTLYLSKFNVLVYMLFGNVLMNYSLLNHYILYAKKQDKSIVRVNLFGGAFSIIASIILIYYFGLLGASLSVLVSGAVVMYLRRKFVQTSDGL